MRVAVGWVLVGIAALLLVANLFRGLIGGMAWPAGCGVVCLALAGLALLAWPGRTGTKSSD